MTKGGETAKTWLSSWRKEEQGKVLKVNYSKIKEHWYDKVQNKYFSIFTSVSLMNMNNKL